MRHLKYLGLLAIALTASVYMIWREDRSKEKTMDDDNNNEIKPTLDCPQESAVPLPSPGVRLHVAGQTDNGLKRTNNEDTFFIDEAAGLFGIFDGMGGMVAGEQASRLACDQTRAFLVAKQSDLREATDEATRNALFHDAFHTADAAIRKYAQEQGFYRIGTTAVVALQQDDSLYLANLGDSRGYLLRSGEKLKRLTQDHTIAAVLLQIGEITEEEARDPGARNRLLAYLGDMGQNKPYMSKVAPLQPGDRVLLCSDGLWDMLTDEEIAETTQGAATPEEAVKQLIDSANKAGGADNITVIALFAN